MPKRALITHPRRDLQQRREALVGVEVQALELGHRSAIIHIPPDGPALPAKQTGLKVMQTTLT